MEPEEIGRSYDEIAEVWLGGGASDERDGAAGAGDSVYGESWGGFGCWVWV